jgi:hypothetical protein
MHCEPARSQLILMLGFGSSWPGLSRPSTSFFRTKTWMRGTSPRMTEFYLYHRPLIPGTSQASRLSRLNRGPDLAFK